MGTVTRPELSLKNKYWLPKHRYYELKHFCLQYPDWKKDYISLDGLPKIRVMNNVRGGEVPNPTAVQAEVRIYYRERMEMVEKAAKDGAGDLSEWMLRAVTEGLSYSIINPPCCKEIWYAAYRRFFWILDKARK